MQSLKHVETLGLIERNPGHGHPFRPEFVLTAKGSAAAVLASRISKLRLAPAETVLIGRAWTLPILRVIGKGAYYRELSVRLEPITDRALSQSLKSMETCNWLTRQVNSHVRPPRVHYAPVAGGALIARHLSVDATG